MEKIGFVFLLWGSITWAQWNIEVVDPQMGHLPSLRLDGQGKAHISYSGGPFNDKVLRYAYYNGTIWNTETVDSGGNTGYWSSLVIDSLNRPHISYLKQISGDLAYLMYSKWDGNSWVIATIDTSDDLYDATNIALDRNDFPHFACHWTSSPYMKYLKWNGTGWDKTIVDSTSPGDGSALIVDSLGRAHLSYFTSTSGGKPVYTYWNGTSWVKNIINDPDFGGTVSSLALDDSLNPQVLYVVQIGGNFIVRHARWNGDSWILSTVDDSAYSGTSALVLDNSGVPHITYVKNGVVKYARLVNSIWVKENVDFGGQNFEFPSIALDSTGIPHIAYGGNGILKYAVRMETGIKEIEMKKKKGVKLKISGRYIILHSSKDVWVTLMGYNLSGRNIGKFFDGVISAGETIVKFPGYFPGGIYFLSIKINYQKETKKMLIVR